jgi:hypothetical protein
MLRGLTQLNYLAFDFFVNMVQEGSLVVSSHTEVPISEVEVHLLIFSSETARRRVRVTLVF